MVKPIKSCIGRSADDAGIVPTRMDKAGLVRLSNDNL